MLQTIRIEEKILGKNEELALRNRQRFDSSGIFAITLSGSPGGGKTSLLECAIPKLQLFLRVGVVEGDIETDQDGRRIAALGCPVTQIVTAGTCHLDAGMVGRALNEMPMDDLDLLFIENVGNLVCPASYSLGEHALVVVISTTEGEDKPLKYPAMFRKADAMVLNKLDLSPYVNVDPAAVEAYARRVRPGLPSFRTSCITWLGIEEWVAWILELRHAWMLEKKHP